MGGRVFLEPPLEEKDHFGRNQKETLQQKFERLPADEQSFFQSGSSFLGLNSSLCGLIANSFFRRVMNITQARFASSLPMVFLPFFTTVVAYDSAINLPLMEGDLNCATCAVVRGGAVGALIGGIYPVLIALPLNALLAVRYSSSPMPTSENTLQYYKMICKPVFKKMAFAIILQCAFGSYLASKHHDIYTKALLLPDPRRDLEELNE